MALTHVLTPLRIGDVEIPNRVVRTAHATLLGGGTMSEDLIAYHEARGRGGVGLSILEPLSVHPSAVYALNIYAPDVEKGYAKLVEQVRPTGMKIFQQLTHSGHNVETADGSPPWSASDLPGFLVGIPPIPMTKGMIDEIIGAFADTAVKMANWGVDGVEIHAAHGYLPIQFLSPILNKRTDDYGGSFENRIRFFEELMTAIRNAVPRGFPVGIRMSTDDNPVMLDVESNIRAIAYLRDRNLIDYVNISFGNTPAMRKAIGGMHEPTGYQMPTSREIGRDVRLPRIVTGRFRTLEEADQIIRDGDADMVSFVRAMIADPDMVNKTIAGHADQVRPCIGCNQGCIGRALEMPYRMGCAINAGAGFERSLGDQNLVPAEAPKKVLVVGGGPAGMEAARVAALRGHKVTLAEASSMLGGAILLAAKAPTRHGMADFTTWLEQEIYRLGVEVRFSTYVEADDLRAEEWDCVIVATGSTPRMDGVMQSNLSEPIRGMDQPHVISSHDLMYGARPNLGNSVVVIDDAGQYEALAVAEYLAHEGLEVNFVTRHVSVAPRAESSLMVEPALIRLSKAKFTPHVRMRALSIDKTSVTIAPPYLPASTNQTVALPADTVVFISLNRGNRALYDELTGKVPKLKIIGDANSARQLPDAVREGHMAGASV